MKRSNKMLISTSSKLLCHRHGAHGGPTDTKRHERENVAWHCERSARPAIRKITSRLEPAGRGRGGHVCVCQLLPPTLQAKLLRRISVCEGKLSANGEILLLTGQRELSFKIPPSHLSARSHAELSCQSFCFTTFRWDQVNSNQADLKDEHLDTHQGDFLIDYVRCSFEFCSSPSVMVMDLFWFFSS